MNAFVFAAPTADALILQARRVWHAVAERASAAAPAPATSAVREQAMAELRERIPRYEAQQPSYAADLQAALTQMERDAAAQR